jgi:osmoprotectant transport system ATP-binding protein
MPRVSELLELVGLDPAEYGAKYPNQLSGGEAQRVGVARALAADPPLLLMDEPFGAVDPLNRERLQAEFARIQRELKKTVIFVTHDVDEAIRLADRVALMLDGHLQQYDAPEALIDHPANKFVHDFMGADRALKRLGRVLVGDSMRTDVPSVHMGDTDEAERAAREDMRFVYLIDGSGHFAGWVDCDLMRAGASIEDSTTLVDWREAAVREDVSLKEALASMLGLGFRSIAVVDRTGILIGEVGLADIERTMTTSDSHINNISGDEDEASL